MLRKVFAFTALMLAPAQASAAWHEAKSKHFVVYADASAEELKSYAENWSASTRPFARGVAYRMWRQGRQRE